ncbi:autotransporter-associated beta strand repeat-containing protein [Luteolibacter arcticus]|uniref:Autotransporter-associated beta strand repeat-containing protein n=1 Tax=Luteolibacter arcticus TaxID=1581411 RepID=A0ABT3GM53_9BACT|nr:autotransporter-associated beta strand repeat-containing protein [Luteolibacter arcticus]MCW1924588.1 autotransporter-associated beta strand repeat-containing protein [Luteolibacter arcticus]
MKATTRVAASAPQAKPTIPKSPMKTQLAILSPLTRSSLIACASLCAATSAYADQTWSGATNADWNTASNWTSAVPTAGDVAIFNAASTANLATTASASSAVAGVSVVDPAAAVSMTSQANTTVSPTAAVTADNATDTFTYSVAPATPLANGDRVTFTVTTLPTGMTAGATYFVVNASPTTFQISTTAGGAAVNFTANGATVVVNGVVLANNATDSFSYSSAFYPTAFVNNTLVSFGAQTAPTGLTPGILYFVVNATATTFQVSNSAGGAPVDFTTDGLSLRAFGNNSPHFTIGGSGINLSAATQNLTIAPAKLVLSASQTWNVGTGRLLTISGTSASTGSTSALTKSGAGILQLNASQLSPSGSVLLSGGETRANAGNFVNLFNSAPITFENGASLTHFNGTGTVTILSNVVVASGHSGTINMGDRIGWGNNDATVETLTGAGTLTLNAATTVSRDDIAADMTAFTGTINFTGSGNVRLFINGGKVGAGFTNSTVDLAGTVNLNPQTNSGGNTINIGKLTGTSTTASLGGGSAGSPNYNVGGLGADSTFDGLISGNASLTKSGAGTLTLTNAALAYTGTTTVSGGTLKLNGTKTGIGATSVSGGTLAGTGTSAGTTTITGTGILAPGDGGIGNINFANLTLSSASILNLQFGVGNDTATVQSGGTLNLASGATVDVNGFGTDGTYTIINTTGATVVGTASTALTAVNGAGGKVYSFSATANAIQMTISGSDPTNYWKIDGGGSWNVAGNWTKNVVPNASGAIAKFGPGPSGLGGFFTEFGIAITMDVNRTVGTLAFNDVTDTVVTIDPGASGILSFDNGASPSILTNIAGNHIINAPIVVDADDLTVDIGDTYLLTVNGTVSGSGAALTKNGLGTLVLAGSNSYDGGTILNGGTIDINSTTSLGNTSGALTFSGGTLRLAAALAGETRSYEITGANNALIDTNGNDLGYDGVISPTGGATGGLSKGGIGVLNLSAAQTYTGTTTLTAGGLNLNAGGSTNGGATNISGGSNFTVAGGSLTAGALSSVTGAAFNITSGTATFNAGLNANTGNNNLNYVIHVGGGTFTSSFVTMGRSSTIINNPVAGSPDIGLYVDGGIANITGALTLGITGSLSSVSARIENGSLTVGGPVTLQVSSGDRWTVFDVNGGTFTSTDAVTGVQIGSGLIGSSAFLVRNGTAAAERILLTQATASTETSRLHVTGGALYVGSGGIVGNNNAGTGILEVLLGGGTLGAKAPWTSSVAATLTGPATIKAADALNAAQDITLSGAVGGTGSLTKTGAGALNLTGTYDYTGNTTVSTGTLSLNTGTLADASTVDVSATGSAVLNLSFSGTDIVAGFSIDGAPQATGTWGSLTSSATHKTARITGDGILNVGGAADPFTDWIDDFPAVGALTAKTDDPDSDGLTNLEEFALDGNPANGNATGKVRSRIETVGADKVLVITLPVRNTATFGGSPSKTATVDDITYTIEGSNNLTLFDQGVTEIAVSAEGMPTPLTEGWTYHTFRLDGAIGGVTPRGPRGFLRITIEDAP